MPNDPTETDPDATGIGFANHGFNAQPGVNGAPTTGILNYVNHVVAGNLHVNGPVTDVDVVALNDDGTPRTVRFSGTCDAFRPACTFSVMVEDNGEPPFNDQFGAMCVSNGAVVEARSMRRIRAGNIQFHSATLETEVDDSTLGPSQVMRLSARLRRDRTGTPSDAYVVLRLPSGQLLSWTGADSFRASYRSRDFVPVDFVGEILQLRVPAGTPPGTYTRLSWPDSRGHAQPAVGHLGTELDDHAVAGRETHGSRRPRRSRRPRSGNRRIGRHASFRRSHSRRPRRVFFARLLSGEEIGLVRITHAFRCGGRPVSCPFGVLLSSTPSENGSDRCRNDYGGPPWPAITSRLLAITPDPTQRSNPSAPWYRQRCKPRRRLSTLTPQFT